MFRLFIAVDFPPDIIAKIARITAYLQTQLPGKVMKWVVAGKSAPDSEIPGECPRGSLIRTGNLHESGTTRPTFI